ncbi:hypothetical protein PR003_g4730 [Phytophthora rubi]|uniref:Uncharacterized protein n=1 Tax=Phytophthora rubi TaxID=129364 RepID=A0A6A4FUB2_9STRA|nr:hypothetical protein PR002_g4858 [Phytophthora rubi]KAE9046496.1 hypothetical protein PR001_g4540 [Phytophthora rubi]KAE9351759.1 hypothetical protein PR003_g4730 [Phytophthora rubi]
MRALGVVSSEAVSTAALAGAKALVSALAREVHALMAMPEAGDSNCGALDIDAFPEPVTPFRFFFPAVVDAGVATPRLDCVRTEAAHRAPTRLLDLDGEAADMQLRR